MNVRFQKKLFVLTVVGLIHINMGVAEDAASRHPILSSKWHGAYESVDRCMVYSDVKLNGTEGAYVAFSDFNKKHKVGSATLRHVQATSRSDGSVLISGSWTWNASPYVCGSFAWLAQGDRFEGVWNVWKKSPKTFRVDYKRKFAWYGQRYAQELESHSSLVPVNLPIKPPSKPPLETFKPALAPTFSSPPPTIGRATSISSLPDDLPQDFPAFDSPSVKTPAAVTKDSPLPVESKQSPPQSPSFNPSQLSSSSVGASRSVPILGPSREDVDKFVQELLTLAK